MIAIPQPTPAEARLVCHRNSYGELICREYRRERYVPREYGYEFYQPRDPNAGCPRGFTRQDGRCKPYRGY